MEIKNLKQFLTGYFVTVLIGIIVFGAFYWYYQTNVRIKTEGKKQELSDLYSSYQTTSSAIVYDLKNGWNLYESKQYKFSIEYSKGWLFEEDSEVVNNTVFMLYFKNLDPNNYPLYKGIYRELPDNFYRFNISIIEGSNNREFFDNLKSDDLEDYTKKVPAIDISINSLKAKKTYDLNIVADKGMTFVSYYIPSIDYSRIYVLTMTNKEPSKISEFEHMLDTFKILDY